MTNTETKVSKAHPAVKALLALTFPSYRGRTISVREVSGDWYHMQDHSDRTVAFYVDLATSEVSRAEQPAYNGGQPMSVVHRARFGQALVMRSFFAGEDMGIEIFVERETGGLDEADMLVAIDAQIEGDRTALGRILARVGATAGIVGAVVVARATQLAKAQARAVA